MTSLVRSPLRSLSAILFAALLALSLIATTVDALAATPLGGDSPAAQRREFFHGRGLRGITWE